MSPDSWLSEPTLAAAAALGVILAWLAFLFGKRGQAWVLPLLMTSVMTAAVMLGMRWERLGHGPFFNLFEILGSNLFSLGLIYGLVYWRRPELRSSAHVVLPVLVLLGAWLWYAPKTDSHFMPTYKTNWLWVHLFAGKIFLGILLTALGVACIVLLRRVLRLETLKSAPADEELDVRAWSLLRMALLFETLMLIAGAVWAQDAWGRYWAWDPLETSAFLTWLALLAALHGRQSFRLGPAATAWMATGVFVLAFLTFFGVPFLSKAPHQGAL